MMIHWAVRQVGRSLAAIAVGGLLVSTAACNNSLGGFSGSVGNTPNGPPVSSYRILGTQGEPFTGVVSDARSSWQISGTVPMDVAVVNNLLPDRLIATKQSSDNGILSLELINGSRVIDVASTTAPFGNVSVQSGKPKTVPPAANPDLRIFVSGPPGERFFGLIEDLSKGYVIDDRPPTLIMFDTPNGTVTGTFDQIQNLGPFEISMSLNGVVVATVSGAPHVVIQEP